MRLLINIPKEFEQHFQADRFEDSLHRLRADIHLMAGLYEQETAEMLIEAFKNAVPVPPHGRLIDADAPISLVDTHGKNIEVTVAHIIENNLGIVNAIIESEGADD